MMRQLFLILFCSIFLASCEEVIDVDLNDAAPRLVIEANINTIVETGASFNSLVRLSTTAPYYDDEVPVVENAIVQIIDENGIITPFEHQINGIYQGPFFPQQNVTYTLQVIYKDERYTAETFLVPTAPLEYVEQRNDGGFLGDKIELKAYFTDFPEEGNFYLFIGTSERGIRRDVFKDEFFNGNSIFGSYMADDLSPGDEVHFYLYGITEEFYNYMFILLQQSGPGSGPFETQPATVRGNIINETNPENYPLGYFRISEISTLSYTVE